MIPLSDKPQSARRSFPFVTVMLVLTNVLVFLYMVTLGAGAERFVVAWGVIPVEILTGRDLAPRAPLSPYFNLIASMFLHGGILHIAGNMLYLWVFGDNVEDRLGHLGYLTFYLATGMIAALTHILVNAGSTIPSIGASGAVAGILAAYVVMFPHAQIRTLIVLGIFITVTRVSAFVLIGFWFLLQVVNGLLSFGAGPEAAGVAFWAHIGGFVAGLVLVRLFDHGPAGRYVSY